MAKLVVPDETDVRIGQRIRDRRLEIGVSQHALATTVGVSFQQLQKYEHARNRVSASRLSKIAEALRTSLDYYVQDAQSFGLPALSAGEPPSPLAADELTLLAAYRRLNEPLRAQFTSLAQAMAEWGGAATIMRRR